MAMTNKHPDDEDIQQYVLEISGCDEDTIDHIRHCTRCSSMAEQYRILAGRIKELEKPAFDFDVSGMVLAQLPRPRQKNRTGHAVLLVAGFIAVVCFSAGLYLFGNSLSDLLHAIKPATMGVILTSAASLLVFLGIDIHAGYKKKMKILNSF
jgi:hypothetical protein